MIEAGRHYLCDEFTALGLKYAPSRPIHLVDVGKSAPMFSTGSQGSVIVPAHDELGMEQRAPRDHRDAEENRRSSKPSKKVLAGVKDA